MTILNDRQIREFSRGKTGMIYPFVKEQQGEGIISYGPSSFGYDMRAGHDWKIFSNIYGATIDPKRPNPKVFQDITVPKRGENFVIIPPNSYALTHSVEYVRMPRHVSAVCLGKSTYARCGIHVNVTPLEAGWEGQVTVEISNATSLPCRVYAGEGIMQVLFFQGLPPDVSYADRKGKYQGQKGITTARILVRDDRILVREKNAAEKPTRRTLKRT
jgi:dCTP deaminase